jgi:very-short-patch-repair endonuclease
MRKNPTPAEKRLWGQLRKKRLCGRKFRRQHVLGNYIVDFFCFSERLAVEIDGPSHDEEQRARDVARDAVIGEMHEVEVVRFANEDVMDELGWVLSEIRRAFEG